MTKQKNPKHFLASAQISQIMMVQCVQSHSTFQATTFPAGNPFTITMVPIVSNALAPLEHEALGGLHILTEPSCE